MLERDGYLDYEEVVALPGYPGDEVLSKKKCAVIECKQNIPCNPCAAACPHNAITIGDAITNLPVIDPGKCIGCGMCVAKCPGLAIFIVDQTQAEEDTVMLPYEHVPVPKAKEKVYCLDRAGQFVCNGTAVKVLQSKAFDRTPVVEVAVPKGMGMIVRNIRTMDKPKPEKIQHEKADPALFVDVAPDDMLVCRCEELTKRDILEAIHNGATNIDEVKRLTRAGMGLCQGRNCRKTVERLIAAELGKDLGEMPPASRRAPVRPVKLSVYTGQVDAENKLK